MALGQASQALGRLVYPVQVALCEMDVDEQREQWAHHGRLADGGQDVVETHSAPLEKIPGHRRLAPGDVERGEGADRVRMGVEPLQEQGGFLEAPLPEAKVREPDQRHRAPRRHAPVEVPG